jgi:hypothetical protein
MLASELEERLAAFLDGYGDGPVELDLGLMDTVPIKGCRQENLTRRTFVIESDRSSIAEYGAEL